MKAYAHSKYTYCDAKILSSFWQQSVEESKARIGRKIGWGGENITILNQMLTDARTQAKQHRERRCQFLEAGFVYEDAKKLAGLWKMSVDQAKANVENKILDGNEAQVRKLLKK
jgi:hypothetical protein